MRRLATLFLVTCCASASASGADLKEAIDDALRALRAVQNEDGTYGTPAEQPLATIAVLQAFGESPEAYTSQDGPFVRAAVEAVLGFQQEDGGFPAAGDADRKEVTRRAITALRTTAREPRFADALARATEFHGPFDVTAGSDAAEAELVARAQALAAGLGAERVAELAATVNEMNLLYAAKQREAKSAPKPTTPGDDLSTTPRRPAPEDAAAVRQRIEEGLAYLAANQKDGRFGFDDVADPGITGMALSAVLRTCDTYGMERPDYVGKGLDWLVSLQKEDGGIYEQGLKNYVTSVAVEALVASGDPKYRPAIDRCTAFLVDTQLDTGEGYSVEEDPYYGGFGYGSSEKPDLSNTQMALDALHAAGLPADHEAYQKAVEFLQRCQNRAETGAPPITKADGTVVVPGDDGGAQYRPGDSKAGLEVRGDGKAVARSYGSMTYALLKSYLFAGLDPADPRVQAAVEWIGDHYTLEVNPGFEASRKPADRYQGLYYYYLTLARALKAYGQDTITDGAGGEHDWRADLRDTLFALQHEDGHWINDKASRWMEGNPVLTTAYALLALAETGA